MLREEFMKYAMNETATITSRRIMNMVERAWVEGKKNAEVEIDDDGDRTNHEYIFNFCPNCGSHIKRCKHG